MGRLLAGVGLEERIRALPEGLETPVRAGIRSTSTSRIGVATLLGTRHFNVGFVFNALNLGQVSAGGDNFSSGERQLLCLARSILPYHEAPAGTASAVLICDEVRTVLSIALEG